MFWLFSLTSSVLGSTEKKEQTAKSPSPSRPSAPRANIHLGVGCDYCGVIPFLTYLHFSSCKNNLREYIPDSIQMYPIIGQRYRCKDCVEIVGFDLCENCHKSSSKLPGRFNQQHTDEHQFELIRACFSFTNGAVEPRSWTLRGWRNRLGEWWCCLVYFL